MDSQRKASRRRAMAVVGWGLALFAAAQLGLNLLTEYWQPGLRDREYGVKLALLRQRLAERPGRPLVLVLGSSRVAVGLRPDAAGADRDGPVVFNFGILGGGPMTERIVLERLLRHGVRPDRVLLEVWPPNMHVVVGATEEVRFGVNRAGLGDACLLSRYASDPADFALRWAQDWLLPWYSNRELLLGRLAGEADNWSEVEGDGWRGQYWRCPAAGVRSFSARARRKYRAMLPKLTMDPNADRALRDAIARCRGEGVPVALVFMPESREFQSFYPAPVRAAVDEYLRALGREFGVAVLDCRDLGPDDGFPDGFHLSPQGADAFSARFAREVLPGVLARSPGGAAF